MRLRQNKRELHELPETEMVKSGTIRLAAGLKISVLLSVLTLISQTGYLVLRGFYITLNGMDCWHFGRPKDKRLQVAYLSCSGGQSFKVRLWRWRRRGGGKGRAIFTYIHTRKGKRAIHPPGKSIHASKHPCTRVPQLCTQYHTFRPKIPSAAHDFAPQTETTTFCLVFCINPYSML